MALSIRCSCHHVLFMQNHFVLSDNQRMGFGILLIKGRRIQIRDHCSVATGVQGGTKCPIDSEKIGKNRGKEGKIGKRGENRKRGKIGKKRQKSGRFFHSPPLGLATLLVIIFDHYKLSYF